MPYRWEGKRRSGVALATRYSLQLFIHPRAQMSIPPTLLVGYDTFSFTCARQAEGNRRGKREKEAMGAKKKRNGGKRDGKGTGGTEGKAGQEEGT